RRGAARLGAAVVHGRLREGGARACRRRAGRHRIAALAQDRYRFGLDHEGGLRALSRPHDRRARARWEMARRLSRPAWRDGRERELCINVFFAFPFADVPDVGMTVQAMTNGKPALARTAADDVATWAWRRREALLKTATVHPIAEGVKLAKEAVARDAWPVV